MFGFFKKNKVDSILDRAEEELSEIKNYYKVDDEQFFKHLDRLTGTLKKIGMLSDLTFEQDSRARAFISDAKRYLDFVNTEIEVELIKNGLITFSEK